VSGTTQIRQTLDVTGRSNYLFREGRPPTEAGEHPTILGIIDTYLSALIRDRGYPMPPIKCASRQIVTTVQCKVMITCINTVYLVL